MSWLEFALNPFPDLFAAPPGGVSAKVKDALLNKRLTDRQIGVAYDYLTRTDHDVMGGTHCITKRTTCACSGSRRGGTRGMCSGTRCRFGRDDFAVEPAPPYL